MAKFTGIPNPNTVVETPHPPAWNRVLWPYTPKCKRVSHPLCNLQKSILWKEGHWLNQIPLSWYINLVNPLIGLGSRDFETHSPLIVRHKVLSKPWSTLQTAAISTWQRPSLLLLSPNQGSTHCSLGSKYSQLPGFGLVLFYRPWAKSDFFFFIFNTMVLNAYINRYLLVLSLPFGLSFA